MNTLPRSVIYRLSALLVIIAILASACGQGEEAVTPDFVVTPAEGGQPAFFNTPDAEGGYPSAVDDGEQPDPGEGGYPMKSATPAIDLAYPPPAPQHSLDGRSLTALEAYELVEDIAREEFHPDAYLSAIVPSHIMISNLGNLPVLPGWFYRFRKPESRREFIIQVVDEITTGSTLTESAMDVSPAELPLDLSQVRVDSDEVLALFNAVAAERGYETDLLLDLELVNLAGGDGPTWSVVEPATRQWLLSVSAITGEEVANPYDR